MHLSETEGDELHVKSGAKQERLTRTTLIRATAFLIYAHGARACLCMRAHTHRETHTPKHLLFTSLCLHYLWGTGERHRREEERRGAKICIGAGSSGTDGGSRREREREKEKEQEEGARDENGEIATRLCEKTMERLKKSGGVVVFLRRGRKEATGGGEEAASTQHP